MAKISRQFNGNVIIDTNWFIYFKSGKLSILAILIGTILFLTFYLLVLIGGVASEDLNNDTHLQGYLLAFLIAYWTLGFLFTILISLIPGVLASMSNTWLLNWVNQIH